MCRRAEGAAPLDGAAAGNQAPGAGLSQGYTLQRRVAMGATSEVYDALREADGTRVAVKLLRAELCLHAEMVARFLNEARTLMELRHPHLVRAFEVGVRPDGRPFMVLEWLPQDLHAVLRSAGGRLPTTDCARLVQQLAGALDHLHRQGFIHRDLKPANVLMACSEPGRMDARLTDLGLAKRSSGAATAAAALAVSTGAQARLGTWDSMAPEQWVDSKRVDAKADVYALGVLWFQLLTGRLPFEAGDEKGLMFQHLLEAPPLALLAASATRSWVGRMLAKKPVERPTLGELLGAFPNLPDAGGQG
ncbi:serine/threonine-protein kinase [Corallococcus sp. BB11-1]|nr:serine/threonine-protein kinase [Corallococcus sp. BB11-1]MCY1036811.1 serine/threonine-protein kinase [Corallococcus sp. BB11-1]